MPTTTEPKKTRRSRLFLYQDGEHVVVGKQYVRYEPDVKKNIFGTTTVETVFPIKRELKHSFRLDLYPDVHEDHPELNIMDDVDQGCGSLFVEANRAAGLLVRSITKIPGEKFSYDNLTILNEDMLKETGNGFTTVNPYPLAGIICKHDGYLFKGDTVKVGDCIASVDDNGKRTLSWECRFDPEKIKWNLKERARYVWLWLTSRKTTFRDRYRKMSSTFELDTHTVHVTSGTPVEETTARGDD